MEQKIKNYEEFIKKATENPKSVNMTREELISYHQEMLQNFQHERLIHLLVTLFFAFVTMVLIFFSLYLTAQYPFTTLIGPYGLTAVIAILTAFYIRHYYFLENHIQNLYHYSYILRQKSK